MRAILIAAALVASVGAAWGGEIPCGFHLEGIHCFTEDTDVGGQSTVLQERNPKPTPPAAPLASHPGRAYTIDEIDRMRAAVERILYGWTAKEMDDAARNGTLLWRNLPSDAERTREIEQRLRTYMAAGVSPEALEAKAKGE